MNNHAAEVHEKSKNICAAAAHNIVLHPLFFKVVCIPAVNAVLIPCNYANDTLMRCNCEFIKQQG